MSDSILDKVISSQKMSAISQFDPEDIATQLFGLLSEREQDIIVKRYGLHGNEKITLEEIGNHYSVTRERIRQVENSSLKKIRDEFNESVLKDIESLIRTILEDHGELMSEEHLIQMLLIAESYNESNAALVRFMLNQLLSQRLESIKTNAKVYKAWALQNASLDSFNEVIDHLSDIIKSENEPIKLDVLIARAEDKVKKIITKPENFEVVLLNYLDVTKKIEENKFNEWGLSHWNTIRPRRMNDKIYLVLKKSGNPMHFVDIANKINTMNFDARVAYPATIHNELILDKKYVLVGRGIYALSEWGYKPGVVLDVIKEILKESDKPLRKEEIIDQVLKDRLVKKSTVVLALMNKKHFLKNSDGYYTLSE